MMLKWSAQSSVRLSYQSSQLEQNIAKGAKPGHSFVFFAIFCSKRQLS